MELDNPRIQAWHRGEIGYFEIILTPEKLTTFINSDGLNLLGFMKENGIEYDHEIELCG
jgi:hypothetical protein